MFEAVLFDFDGVLVDYVDSDIQSLRWLHSCVKPDVCFADFLDTAVEEIMIFHRLVDAGQANPLQMHEFRLKRTFQQHKIIWREHYVNIYKDKLLKTCVPFPGVPEMLAAVKQKVKTGLVTNAYDGKEQRKRIANAGLVEYFDAIIVAGEIGVYKPAPAIFLQALQRIETTPDATLFVGDSITHDMVGAKSVGMTTVLFHKNSTRNSDAADYTAVGAIQLKILLTHLLT
ncbi:MAG TPA: HAD family hydrolase [Anaerolineae bacterium]|nr:HAD family hydrolase [Anaerolineae bacterium]